MTKCVEGVFIDLETGGLDPVRCAITEIGAVHFKLRLDADPEIIGQYQTLVYPYDKEYNEQALKIQGRIKKDLEAGIPLAKAIKNLLDFLKKSIPRHFTSDISCKVYAHNAPFDYGFIRQAMIEVDNPDLDSQPPCPIFMLPPKSNWNDTSDKFKKMGKMGYHPLNTCRGRDIAEYYKVTEDLAGEHTAIRDCIVAIKSLDKMLKDVHEQKVHGRKYSRLVESK